MRAHGPERGAEVGPDLDVEVELVKERAEALGRSGRALEEAVAAYRSARAAAGGALAAEDDREHIGEIAARLYRLVIQRECSGARHGNLEAIRAAYDVPEAAFRRM